MGWVRVGGGGGWVTDRRPRTQRPTDRRSRRGFRSGTQIPGPQSDRASSTQFFMETLSRGGSRKILRCFGMSYALCLLLYGEGFRKQILHEGKSRKSPQEILKNTPGEKDPKAS